MCNVAPFTVMVRAASSTSEILPSNSQKFSAGSVGGAWLTGTAGPSPQTPAAGATPLPTPINAAARPRDAIAATARCLLLRVFLFCNIWILLGPMRVLVAASPGNIAWSENDPST